MNPNRLRMERWRVQSPEEPGFHPVIIPDKSECRVAHVYRLNLQKNKDFLIESGNLELHPILIDGNTYLGGHPSLDQEMNKFDSFYIPAQTSVTLTALEDSVFYIAGAPYEGIGEAVFRKYDPDLPIGEIHQIHGEGAGRREVMFTLATGTPASRLICGLTWGGNGSWTSWPPHQHEKDLEEVYCYLDMPAPALGFHISYLESGGMVDSVVHPVRSGTMVEVPCGYHPTVAPPGIRNTYFWVLASFSAKQRRYDLAIPDPEYLKF
ncbi:5-deoxy-glucuronate isomerase [Fretibacterium sp. OH1220_COT-178]|uniref:5-deoxy-glucuronate isomerase n=1 Tax=Fretibacterium sp. OH1220_COT-178 TaxID=2491047 RepID=UPI0018F6ED1B|nr:5-deoxy-glucuronate isomerase [Fretibacterium sp. OH1220_COT-178]